MNRPHTSGRSAERRVMLVFVLTAVTGVLLVGVALRYIQQRHEMAQARTYLAGRARTLAQSADSEMIEAQRNLEFLSRTPAFRQLLCVDRVNPAICGVPEEVEVEKRQLLAEMMRMTGRFSVLYVVQTNGDIYLLHPFAVQTNLTRFNLADRPYFQEAARTRQSVVSDSVLGADRRLAAVILVPILDPAGDAVAYLGAAFYLTQLSQLLTKERIRPFDAGFMVDRQGHLIAHTDTRMLEGDARERFAKSPFVSEVLRQAPGAGTEGVPGGDIGEYVDPADGKCYVTARIPMRSGWSVGLMRDRAGIAAEARSVVWRITLLTALLFLMVCAIGVATAHRIGRSWDAAERALRASEDKYRNLFEGALDAIVVASAETGTIIDCNRAATLLWGREKSELVGQHQRILHPPEEGKGEFSRTFQEHLREQEGQVLAARIATKKGEIRGVEIMANLVELGGQRVIQGIFRDITERQRAAEALNASEVRYRRLFETARDGILILDAETGMVVDVNPFLIEMLGYSHAAFLGKKVWELGFFKDIVANQANFAELQQKEYIRYEDKPLETADGRRIEVEFVSNFYLGSDRKVIQCNLRDITERKRAEAQLQRSLADLERSNQELEQFAYIASHDLQEPLRMVASYTQLLAQRYEGQLDDKAKKFIRYAVDGAIRMQTLINDLLAYSRVGTRGKAAEPTDSHAVLGEAIRNLAATIAETRAIITNDDLPTVRADASQLVLVFQNLLANAIKFRRADLPRVHVSAQNRQGEWVFAVKDNGIGIEPQHAERVFVIFQRLHTREEYPGTGIGLAICKRIVERHGGKIWFEAEPGNGATFFFTVPK